MNAGDNVRTSNDGDDNDNSNVVNDSIEDELRAFERPKEADVLRWYASIIRRLRGDGGCPWDRKQTLLTLRRYVIEEAFELLAAINEGSTEEIAEEIGDVLLVTYLISDALEKERGITLSSILRNNGNKLIRRHPHVFDEQVVKDSEEVIVRWNEIKQREGRSYSPRSIGPGLPPMERAYEIQKKASKLNFDWPNVGPVLDKVSEEIDELRKVIAERGAERDIGAAKDDPNIENELGDLLFATVNVCRFLKTDPSVALARTNEKFLSRFEYLENVLQMKEKQFQECSLEELDTLWNEAKARESTE